MSTATLSTSPSPAASPRNTFRHHSFSSRSPRASPKLPFAASPRRAFNAPAVAPAVLTKQPREHFVESGPSATVRSVYVDVGTQYSPSGSPPTSTRSNLAVTRTKQQQPAGVVEGGAKKRKESVRSDSPPGEPMSGVNSGASSSSAPRPAVPPTEPDPRRDPSAINTPEVSKNSNHVASTSAPKAAAEEEQEPEEARSTLDRTISSKRSRPDSTSTKVMPRQYWTCNPKDLGVLISNMLMELIRLNDRIPLRDGKLTRFHSRAPPGISVSDYLQRLIQHATLSPPILLSMVYYIDRLCALYSAFTINSLTVHRFLITAATVAAKGLSDSFWTNPTYARIGGIPVTELATLELEFLQKVHWKIVPRPEVLEEYYRSLVERTDGFALEEGGEESSSSLDESVEGAGSEGGDADADAEEDGDARMVDKPT